MTSSLRFASFILKASASTQKEFESAAASFVASFQIFFFPLFVALREKVAHLFLFLTRPKALISMCLGIWLDLILVEYFLIAATSLSWAELGRAGQSWAELGRACLWPGVLGLILLTSSVFAAAALLLASTRWV